MMNVSIFVDNHISSPHERDQIYSMEKCLTSIRLFPFKHTAKKTLNLNIKYELMKYFDSVKLIEVFRRQKVECKGMRRFTCKPLI